MQKTPDHVQVECRRLREEERLSIGEIQSRLKLSRATISALIRGMPLTKEELKSKRGVPYNKGERKTIGQRSRFFDQIEKNNLSPMQKANTAEAAVLFRLCVYGFKVFGSPFDCDREDWLVLIPTTNRVWKIQVKVVQYGLHGLPRITLQGNHGHKRYQETDFDFIVGYDMRTDVAYVFSFGETKGNKSSVAISDASAEAWDKLRV